MNIKSKMKSIIKLVGVGIFLFIICRLVDLPLLFESLRRTELYLLVIAILFLFPLYLFKSIRLKLILARQNIVYSLKDIIIIVFSSNYLGFITPGRVGEFAKCLYLNTEKKIPLSRSFPPIFSDRIFDLLFLVLLGGWGLVYFNLLGKFSGYYLFVTIILCLLTYVLLNRKFISRILKISLLQKNKKLKYFLNQYYQGLIEFDNVLEIFLYLLITCVAYLFLFVQCYFVAESLGIRLPYFEIALIMSITNLMTFIPISISGIGTRDITLVYLFSLIGLSSENAMAYSILVFLTFNLIGGAIGLFCWYIKPINISMDEIKGMEINLEDHNETDNTNSLLQ